MNSHRVAAFTKPTAVQVGATVIVRITRSPACARNAMCGRDAAVVDPFRTSTYIRYSRAERPSAVA
jgi:hypothetical protein